MKDRFSTRVDLYKNFRPGYPPQILEMFSKLLSADSFVLDCGTGNGQLAILLATYFKQIIAIDVSENQILSATKHPSISYRVASAEKTGLADQSVDLITVAQAVHWFNFNQFYKEVKRILKPNGFIAIVGYGLLQVESPVKPVLDQIYYHVLKNFWDPERKYIDEEYKTIPFPFDEKTVPTFSISYQWTVEQFIGYLCTWSACKLYESKNGLNPVEELSAQIRMCWGTGKRQVTFPTLLRLGTIRGLA